MNEREERLSKHVETLMKMKDVMINDENWERLKPEIDAVIAGGMALQASIDNGKFVSMSVIENIKAEINNIDSMTFIGSGSGCASEMRAECLKIIDHICKESEDKE